MVVSRLLSAYDSVPLLLQREVPPLDLSAQPPRQTFALVGCTKAELR